MQTPTMLSVPPDCLLIFLDETGHERMPNGHTHYGIGGCPALMRDYENIVVQPWRALRYSLTGNPDAHLHAAEFVRTATSEQMEEVASVFTANPFMRIGSVGAITTAMPQDKSYKDHLTSVHEDEHLAWMVLRSLHKRIVDVAKWTQFRSAAIVFEQNPRSKALLQSAFANFGIEENGVTLPIEFHDMPKIAGEPGLELADFVAHTVAGHGRRRLVEGRTDFRKDFKVVFQSAGPKLSSFMAINSIDFTPSMNPSTAA